MMHPKQSASGLVSARMGWKVGYLLVVPELFPVLTWDLSQYILDQEGAAKLPAAIAAIERFRAEIFAGSPMPDPWDRWAQTPKTSFGMMFQSLRRWCAARLRQWWR